MPQPMLKESPPPELSAEGLSRRPGPLATPEILARARELERELGHPLREDIDSPLNEEEEEELLVARIAFGTVISAEEFYAKHGLNTDAG